MGGCDAVAVFNFFGRGLRKEVGLISYLAFGD